MKHADSAKLGTNFDGTSQAIWQINTAKCPEKASKFPLEDCSESMGRVYSVNCWDRSFSLNG